MSLQLSGIKTGTLTGPPAAITLEDLYDVSITSPTNGQFLQYSSGIWINGSGGASITVSNVTSNSTFYPTFTSATSGTLSGIDVSSTTLTYNPSGTGTLTTGTFVGALTGNASTATSATSATSATTATNLAGGAAGSIPYQTGSGATTMLAAGTNGYVLTMVSGAPAWAASTGGVTSFSAGSTGFTPSSATTGAITLAGTLAIGFGGTGQTTKTAAFDALSPLTTQGDVIYYNGTNNVRLAAGTSGQVLTTQGSSANPTWTTVLTTIGGSSGQIQYNNSGVLGGYSDLVWTPGSTPQLQIGNPASGGGSVTLVPATPSVASVGANVILAGSPGYAPSTIGAGGGNVTIQGGASVPSTPNNIGWIGGSIYLNSGVGQHTPLANAGSIYFQLGGTTYFTFGPGGTLGLGSGGGAGSVGTSGQVLTSGGASANPTWSSLSGVSVTSFSAGTTGFTPSSATTGAITLAGTLAAGSGGTGQTSYTVGDILYASAATTLSKLSTSTAGEYLRSAGPTTAPLWSTLVLPNSATAGDLFYGSSSNTMGNLAVSSTAGTFLRSTGSAPQWSTLVLPNAATAGAIAYGSSSTALAFTAAGSANQVLQSAGAGTPTWTSTPTITGTNFSGIPNGALTNSSVTIGSTSVSLGSTVTAFSGLTGITFTSGTVTGLATPVASSDAATKAYVDSAVQALNLHLPVEAATTTALSTTYTAGSADNWGGTGVGATLTSNAKLITGSTSGSPAFVSGETVTQATSSATATVFGTVPNAGPMTVVASSITGTPDATHTWTGGTSGATFTPTATPAYVAFSVDGYNGFATTDRTLIKNQTTQTQNGIYTVTTLGTSSVAWVLTRATDYNNSNPGSPTDSEGDVHPGDFIFVQEGTTQAGTSWVETAVGTGTNDTIKIGTDNIVFTQFGGPGSAVSSFSAGTTGFTPNTATTGAVTLAGTLALASGGTNASLTASNGQVTYSTSSALALTTGGATNSLLQYNSGSAPTWTSTPTITGTNISGTASSLNIGGNAATATTATTATNVTGGAAGSLVYQTGSSTTTTLAAGTANQVLVSGSTPAWTGSPSITGLTLSGALNNSNSSNSITSGTTQGSNPITTDYNVYTTVNSGIAATLPAGTAGRLVTIVNRGTNALTLFPASGAAIDGLAANASISIPVNASYSAQAISSTQWYTIDSVIAGTANQIATSSASGTITLSTPSTFVAPGTIQDTTGLYFSTSAAVSAAGSTQGTATALTKSYNVVTTVASGTGVVLQTPSVAGLTVTVVNKGANTLNIYPATGGTIDALGTNAAITLAVGGMILFDASSTTQWYSTSNLSISSTSTATNLAGGTANQIPYQTAANTTSFFSASNYGVATYGATGVPASIAGAAGVLQGSASAIPAFTTTPSLSTLTLSSAMNFSNSSLSIASGTTQGSNAITTDYNVYSSVVASGAATLPTGTAGRLVTIVNRGANSITLFPASGGQIDSLGTNASLSIGSNTTYEVQALSSTQWYSIGTNAVSTQNVAVTNNTSSVSTWYPTFVAANSGNNPITVNSSALTFVPSTGTLTATLFQGEATNIAASANTSASVLSVALLSTGSGNASVYSSNSPVNVTVTPSSGLLTAVQLKSTVATGTAPLVIASTTQVTNLTAQNSGNTLVTTTSTNANYPITLSPSNTTGQQSLLMDTSFLYDPGTTTITIGSGAGAGLGIIQGAAGGSGVNAAAVTILGGLGPSAGGGGSGGNVNITGGATNISGGLQGGNIFITGGAGNQTSNTGGGIQLSTGAGSGSSGTITFKTGTTPTLVVTISASSASTTTATGTVVIASGGLGVAGQITSNNESTGNINVTGSGLPANGMYLPAANTLGWTNNTVEGMTLSGGGTSSATLTLFAGGSANTATITTDIGSKITIQPTAPTGTGTQGGSVTISPATNSGSSSTATAGDINILGVQSISTGGFRSSNITITAGAAPTSGTANGAFVTITAGSTANTATPGGAASLVGGTSSVAANGGAANVTGGNTTTSTGGAVNITAGSATGAGTAGGIVLATGTVGSGTNGGSITFKTGTTASTLASQITKLGSIVDGSGAALSTSATDGFTYIPGGAGTPTGAPTAFTGSQALYIDTTNNLIYFYNAAWKSAVVNLGGGAANQIPYQTGAGATSFFGASNYGVATYGATGVPASIAGAAGVLQGSASAIPAFTTTPTLTGTNFSGTAASLTAGNSSNTLITTSTTAAAYPIALSPTSSTGQQSLLMDVSVTVNASTGVLTAGAFVPTSSTVPTNGMYLSAANTLNFSTNTTKALTITSAQSTVHGTGSALSTSATDGFTYIPGGAGPPTGVPTSFTGSVPLYIDTTNNVVYFYTNSTWFSSTQVPQNAQSSSTTYTLVLSDASKHIYITTSSFTTCTVPANSSVAFPIGTAVTIVNQSGGNITIPITTDTMYLGGVGTTGTRTLGNFGVATLLKVTSTSWFISGTGLT